MFLNRTKTVIIAGVGRFGAELAGRLSGKYTRLVVIDKDKDAFARLPEDFDGFKMVGDGTDAELLKKAGIEHARIFIAATDDDNVNILASQIASRIYRVPDVFSRLNDKSKEKLIQGFSIKPICPFTLSVDEFGRLEEQYQEAGAV